MSLEQDDQNAKSEKPEELDLQDKLKGDVIGDTMYTQRFVLKTILKLKSIEWNEELEEDLCFLWDSTVERDVCEYLLSINFPSIACSVILEYNTVEYGRLIEILVGIMANIITAKCIKQIEMEHMNEIFNLLSSTDPLVLVQVMRFFTAFSHNSDTLTCLDSRSEFIFHNIKFILSSTTNFELIQKTLEALAKMTENSKTCFFFNSEMMNSAISSCIRSVTEDEENDFELFTNEQRCCVKYLIEYILHFCVYLNQESNKHILNTLIDDGSNYIDLFIKICKWYSIPENLLPITDELLFYFEASNYIFAVLQVEYNSKILEYMFVILKILIKNKCDDVDEFIEMFCYFVQKGESEQIKIDSKKIPEDDVMKICQFIERQDVKYNLESEKFKSV